MIQPGERAPSVAAELFRHSPDEARLAEALTATPEFIAKHEAPFWQSFDQLLALTTNEHDHDSLLIVSRYIHWQYFGQPGDALPDGFALYRKDDQLRLAIDGSLDQAYDCLRSAVGKWEHLRDRQTYIGMRNELLDSNPRFREAARSLVEANPVFQLFESFDTKLPEKRPQPLAPRQRGIRESQIERSVAEAFRLPEDSGRLPIGSPAELALRRELWHLDDETRLAPKTFNSDTDAYSNLRRFVADHYVDFQAFSEATTFSPEERQKRIKDFCENAVTKYEPDFNEYMADRLDIAGGNPIDYTIKSGLAEILASVIYKAKLNVPYSDFLAEIADSAADRLLGRIDDATGVITLLYPEHYSYTPDEALRLWLLRPEAPIYLYDTISRGPENHEHPPEPEMSYITRSAYELQRTTVVGEVDKSPLDGPHLRLIQPGACRELPAVSGDEDLILNLNGDYTWGPPYIPGYQLVGNSGTQYSFLKDEFDPYAEAAIPISADQVATLQTKYTEMGLVSLSEALGNARGLTAHRLTELIRSELRYVLPDKVKYQDTGVTPKLQNFTDFVHNGRLQVQCSGAAHFLALSLRQIFGDSAAGTIEGFCLKNSSYIINGLQHMQTSFAYDGRTYILDATPTLGSECYAPTAQVSQQVAAPKSAGAETTIAFKPGLHKPEVDEHIDPSQTREQQLAQLQKSFKGSLLALFKTVRLEEVFNHIHRLGESDPLRRTTETILRATVNLETQEGAKDVHTYLENYNKASAAKRSSLRLRSYDSRTVGILRKNLRQLVEVVSGTPIADAHGD